MSGFKTFLANQFLTESDGEGKLRTVQGGAVEVNPSSMMVMRNLSKLEKDKEAKKISDAEYEKKKKLINSAGSKLNTDFDYDRAKTVGNEYDNIPDKREVPNRHVQKRGQKPTKLQVRHDKENFKKRMSKRVLTTANFSGVNKAAEGEHKTAYKQLAKHEGIDPTDPMYVNYDTNKKRFNIASARKNDNGGKPVATADKLYRVSKSKNATYARPSNKASDGVVYPDARIYAADSLQTARRESPNPQNKALQGYEVKTKKDENWKIDPESSSGKSSYLTTRYKHKVGKSDKSAVPTAQSVLANFYKNL